MAIHLISTECLCLKKGGALIGRHRNEELHFVVFVNLSLYNMQSIIVRYYKKITKKGH